jgi:IS6 family transposase
LEIDPSCIWRWVQQYGPELEKRCRPHLKPTNKSQTPPAERVA